VAGFAFVRELEEEVFQIAEFYIKQDYRGSGVGRQSATEIFDKFRGTWHVAQEDKNIPAQKFWRSVIGSYTGGEYTEEKSKSQPLGVKQIFDITDNV